MQKCDCYPSHWQSYCLCSLSCLRYPECSTNQCSCDRSECTVSLTSEPCWPPGQTRASSASSNFETVPRELVALSCATSSGRSLPLRGHLACLRSDAASCYGSLRIFGADAPSSEPGGDHGYCRADLSDHLHLSTSRASPYSEFWQVGYSELHSGGLVQSDQTDLLADACLVV